MANNGTKNATRKRISTRIWIAIAGPLVLILAGVFYFVHGSHYASTDNAYIKADRVAISAEVSGQLTEVAVGENQHVHAGQLLFTIDDQPYEIALERSRAAVRKATIDLNTLRARYRQKQAELKGSQVDAAYFDHEYRRQKDLAGSKVASESKVDQTRHDYEAARQDEAKLEQELQEILAELEGNPDLPLASYPPYRDAQAGLERAKLDLSHTRVVAPADGIIAKTGNLQVGNYAFAGAPMASLMKTGHLWIEANLKETDLTHVQVGQKATAVVDTYPGRNWKMVVASVAPATGAEFAILPPQNATGNWVKVVQRIPVKLEFENPADHADLRAGMSTSISIDVGAYYALPRAIRSFFGGK